MPLAYQEVLPLVKLSMPLVVPALSPPPPELPARTQSSSPMRARGPSHVFTAPPRVPPGPVRQFVDSFDDAPQVPVLSTGFSPFPLVNTGITRADIAEPVQRSAPQVSRGADPAPVRLGGVVLSALLIKKVIPVYPSLARQARISGAVHLEGILAKDGTIRNLQVLSGHPLLVPAALDAVRQWVYRPTLLNGVPVEVIAPIDVVFTLN